MQRPDIDAIKKRRAVITPGQWIEGEYNNEWEYVYVLREEDGAPPHVPVTWLRSRIDRRFIAHAPADIDALLAYIEELEAR